MTYLTLLLTILHVLASAAWFGAMVYSLFVLHPRAKRYFASPSEFEDFIGTLAQGARWKVLGGLAVIGLTGTALAWLQWSRDPTWQGLMAVKTGLFMLAVIVFCYTSWSLWPRRVLAIPEEVPGLQAAFRRVAITLVTIAGLTIALGVGSPFLLSGNP